MSRHDGYFFDILGQWKDLVPYLKHPKFTEALNLYHWWKSDSEDGNEHPLIRGDDNLDLEEAYVYDRLDQPKDYTNIYWYVVPHDCVELNSIVLGTLMSLYFDKPIYSLIVEPPSDPSPHVILSNKQLQAGDVIYLPRGSNDRLKQPGDENQDLILYDLIYPTAPFFGDSWVENKRDQPIDSLVVTSSCPLEEMWSEMNYTLYYNK